MKFKLSSALNLKALILFLTTLSAIWVLISAFNAAYTVQRQLLIDSNQHANYIYAKKLANSIDDFIHSAQQQLSVSATVVADQFNNEELLHKETDRLRSQTNSFNSVAIVNSGAEVLAASPETLGLVGKKIYSDAVSYAIKNKVPSISDQYLSAAGNLIILITYPVINSNGDYLGLISGTIYLKQSSILDSLLGKHFYEDGSYLYVVDKGKKIIYHPNPQRVGEVIAGNHVIDQLVSGESGGQIVTNSLGIEMVAGYANVPSTHWGVVSQTPVEATLNQLSDLMLEVILKVIPAFIVLMLLIWWCSRSIAKPLMQLAQGAQAMNAPETQEQIQSVRSWYFEAHELKKAMSLGVALIHSNIKKLKEDAHTDPLTSIGNRRFLEMNAANLIKNQTAFSVIAIDIDHFKNINDTYGHDIGDAVLKGLAICMQGMSRADDILCRTGGEEFLMVLPGSDNQSAKSIAERLRMQVESVQFDTVGSVTVSVGVASYPQDAVTIEAVLKAADAKLYQAKRNGRNRVES